jgi:lipoprotein
MMKKQFLFLSLALGLVACNAQSKTVVPETSEVETTAKAEVKHEEKTDNPYEMDAQLTAAVGAPEFGGGEVAGPIKDATADVLEARRAARNDYGLAPLKDPDPSRSHPGTFQMVSEFNIREVEDLRDRLVSQSGSYISDFMVPSNVILFPKHLTQTIRGNSVLEVNTDAGENNYYHYRNIPTYIKDGTDAGFLDPYLNGRTPNFTGADGINYTQFLVQNLVDEFHTTNYDPMEPIEPDQPETISTTAEYMLRRIKQEASEPLPTHQKNDPKTYTRFGEFDLVGYMRDNGFNLRLADSFPALDVYTFICEANPKLMIRFDANYGVDGKQINDLGNMADFEKRLVPYRIDSRRHISGLFYGIGVNGIEVYYVKDDRLFPNSGYGRTDARPEDFYHVMHKMKLTDVNHQGGSYFSNDGNVLLLSPELSAFYAEMQLKRFIENNPNYDPSKDQYRALYYVREDSVDLIKRVVERTNALVGHESNLNRDDLFRDIDANVIVSRN